MLKKVIAALAENKISDVISFTPKKLLNIKYNGKEVNVNDTLTPTIVQNAPQISYEAKDDELYTLIMTDPDAPTRSNAIYGEWRHWVLTNIQGNKIETANPVLDSYIGAGPPEKTGLHRYIFILCKQPSRIDFKGEFICPTSGDKRNNWKSSEFIKKWNLEPEAINFFQAEYDEYVPNLYKKLGECKEKPVEIK